jgi:hypothetical protein
MLPTIAQTSTNELETSIMGWFVVIMLRLIRKDIIALASTKILHLMR